jgi:trehalose/maltose hydrolase-like predicted phosphorylase
MSDGPINPAPASGRGDKQLPAYVSNGLIGLRVPSLPVGQGMALLNGFAGEHPERKIEAAAVAPYPVFVDLAVEGVWLSDVPHEAFDLEQAYDFGTGELTSRFKFAVCGRTARCELLTFASREDPTLVCQELSVRVDRACDLQLRVGVDARGVDGIALRHLRETPGAQEPTCDGALLWESAGGYGRAGCAYVTRLTGGETAGLDPERPALAANRLISTYRFRASARAAYRLEQVSALVASVMHSEPDQQAARLAAKAKFDGFASLRSENRARWRDLWKGRIRLVGASARWQALADAAFFYVNSSVHPSSPASTSIFGMATWHDYHYYYGHVMWDIEAFVAPVLSLVQPDAAEALLNYRLKTLPAALANARLMGRRGAQFAWESAPSTGSEATPLPGRGSWHEDHVSLDVAKAFAVHADAAGDEAFRRDKAWPVLSAVSAWLCTRVKETRRGFEIPASMGIAEREQPVDNAAFTNMAAVVVLRAAIRLADHLGFQADPRWDRIAWRMWLPRRQQAVASHDDFRFNEQKGATPDPLMGIWPMGYPLPAEAEAATIQAYLAHAEDYIGSPMLSALYSVWAARVGDRKAALKLFEEGYAQFAQGRFDQILEYRPDRFPDQPRAGPFFANMGGFLSGLLFGLPRLEPNDEAPNQWARAPVVLPEGWSAIEVDRLYVRGQPMRLVARHGARAVLEPVAG